MPNLSFIICSESFVIEVISIIKEGNHIKAADFTVPSNEQNTHFVSRQIVVTSQPIHMSNFCLSSNLAWIREYGDFGKIICVRIMSRNSFNYITFEGITRLQTPIIFPFVRKNHNREYALFFYENSNKIGWVIKCFIVSQVNYSHSHHQNIVCRARHF